MTQTVFTVVFTVLLVYMLPYAWDMLRVYIPRMYTYTRNNIRRFIPLLLGLSLALNLVLLVGIMGYVQGKAHADNTRYSIPYMPGNVIE